MDSFISTFHIDWKIIIAQAINFFIVLTVLYFLALKPLRKLMAERSSKIEGGLEDAKQNADMLKKTRDEYAKVISNARTEANAIFQEGKRDAETKKAEMLEIAKSDVDTMIANGKKALEREKTQMVEDARKEIVSLVVAATEKLLVEASDGKLDSKIMKRINKM